MSEDTRPALEQYFDKYPRDLALFCNTWESLRDGKIYWDEYMKLTIGIYTRIWMVEKNELAGADLIVLDAVAECMDQKPIAD